MIQRVQEWMPSSPSPNLKFSLTGPYVEPEIYKFLSPWYLGIMLHCDNAEGFLFKVTYYSLVVINTLPVQILSLIY